MNFYIDQAAVHAMHLLTADKTDMRYDLQGVHFKVRGDYATLTATDGRLAGIKRCHVTSNSAPLEAVEFIMPTELVKKLKPGKNDSLMKIEFSTGGRLISVETCTGRERFLGDAIDGRFPDMGRVVPSTVNNEIAQFDPELLAKFQKYARLSTGSKAGYIVIAHNGEAGASLVSIGDPDFFGIVMGLRCTNIPDTLKAVPTWFRAPVAERVAA